jgi:hypothetical protein
MLSSKPSIIIAALLALVPASGFAQDCPTAQSGKSGFVVERGESQKSEIFHLDGGIVRTAMRYNGTVLLETTQYEGLFQLDRLEKGQSTNYEPQSDLKKLFPLKAGQNVSAMFKSSSGGQPGQLRVDIAVKGAADMYIGPCKYSVLKLERSESRSAEPPRFVYTDDYSPVLKLILAKEYRRDDGPGDIIKYDRIYPLKR